MCGDDKNYYYKTVKMNTVVMKTPFAYWNNLFCDTELQQIDEYAIANLTPEIARIGDGINNDENEVIRKSKIYWILPNNETAWIFDKINAVGFKLNSHFFGFDIRPLSRLQYTIYEGGGSHYDWHTDCFYETGLSDLNIQFQRKLSVVIMCQKAEQGGQLELVNGPQPDVPLLENGTAVAFPSFMLHRVSPVESGLRKTIVVWFEGPDWR
jgi:PKHD-type hydroxylase